MINMHEFPLVLFTVLSQSAVGAFIWCTIALCCIKDVQQRTRLNNAMFAIWVLMGLALALSTLHLGMPLRATNSLIRTGHSPLSNEIVGAALFSGFGFICWLINWRQPGGSSIGKALGWVGILAGIFFIWAMSGVYRILTVPVWDTCWTLLAFIGTTLVSGSILAALLLAFAKINCSNAPSCARIGPLVVAGIGIVIGLIAAIAQITDMSMLQHAAMRNLPELVKACVCLTSIRLVLLLVGMMLWACHACRKNASACSGNPTTLLIAFLLIMVAEMCGRLVFYSMNMTVGLI